MKLTEILKKVLSILLCLCMVVQYVPATAFAAETDTRTVYIALDGAYNNDRDAYVLSCQNAEESEIGSVTCTTTVDGRSIAELTTDDPVYLKAEIPSGTVSVDIRDVDNNSLYSNIQLSTDNVYVLGYGWESVTHAAPETLKVCTGYNVTVAEGETAVFVGEGFEVTNYGTILAGYLTGRTTNHGVLAGGYYSGVVTNSVFGVIEGGFYPYQIQNSGKITGGEFSGYNHYGNGFTTTIFNLEGGDVSAVKDSGATIIESVDVTVNFENLTFQKDGGAAVSESPYTDKTIPGEDYCFVLTAGENYAVPDSITLTIGGVPMDPNLFVYYVSEDSKHAEVYIGAEMLTGDMVITAAGYVPVTAPVTRLTVGDTLVADKGIIKGPVSGEGWSYDAQSNTLTLTDAAIAPVAPWEDHENKGIYCQGDLNLAVNGTNTISVSRTDSESNLYGIDVSGNLHISGTGTLNISTGDAVYGYCYGIRADESITVDGPTLDVSSGNNVYTMALSAQDFTLTSGSVTLCSGEESTAYDFYCYSAAINGGTLTLKKDDTNKANVYCGGSWSGSGTVIVGGRACMIVSGYLCAADAELASGADLDLTGVSESAYYPDSDGTGYAAYVPEEDLVLRDMTLGKLTIPYTYQLLNNVLAYKNGEISAIVLMDGQTLLRTLQLVDGAWNCEGGQHLFEEWEYCTYCDAKCPHTDINEEGICTVCGMECPHDTYDENGHCTACGVLVDVTVTFDYNGGIFASYSADEWDDKALVSLPWGETVTLGAGDFSKYNTEALWEGYNLTGWNTKADGTGTDYGLTGTFAAQSMTIYAQWEKCTHEDHTIDGCDCGLTDDTIHVGTKYADNGDGTHDKACTCGKVLAINEPHSTTAADDKADTCTSKAYCSVCKSEYGEVDSTKHTSDTYTNGFRDCCGEYEPAVWNEANSVYEISNAGQLYWFAAKVNSGETSINGKLMDNIVVNEGTMTAETTGARAWTPIGNSSNTYTGTFDGAGKTVSGLFTDVTTSYVGLFGYLNGGTVKNVGVVNSYFSGKDYVGGVAGTNFGLVENCYNAGTVSGSGYVGGVVGSNSHTVKNCHNTGAVTGTIDYIGGVAGSNSGTVENSYNTGMVTVSGNSVGGVVGHNNGTVGSSYNTGTVTGGDYVGGVVGYNYNKIVTNCHNTGTVSGSGYVGGIVGMNNAGTVENSYNTGDVSGSGDRVGGVAGYSNGIVKGSYNTGTVSGRNHVGGVAGQNYKNLTNCYNTGEVTGSGYIGGVAGYNFYSTIENSYNTGSVSSSGNRVGGVAGYSSGTLENAYNTGTISGSGVLVGGVAGYGSGTITNCYYRTGCAMDGNKTVQYGIGNATAGSTTADVEGSTTGMTEAQFASGEVAYLLQGAQTAVDGVIPQVWGQNIGTHATPNFTGDKVYYGYISCADDAVIGYTNNQNASETKPAHSITAEGDMAATCANGAYCSVCESYYGEVDMNNHDSTVDYDDNGFCPNGCYEPAVLNADDYYEIGNAGQLFWFARKVNGGENTISAVLTASIDLETLHWEAMGQQSAPYTGTFDGQGYTISNMSRTTGLDEGTRASFVYYLGEGGCIKNVTFDHADVFTQGHANANASAVVALRNSGTIESVVVSNSQVQLGAYAYLAGIAGVNESSGVIKNCAVLDTALIRRFGHNKPSGGIVYNNLGTVENCYTYNCSYDTANESNGGIVVEGNAPVNSYYYTTSTVAVADYAKTAEQFASGEVAYLLQGEQTEQVWGQDIGTDDYPVLGGEKVYYGYTACADTAKKYTNDANVSDSIIVHVPKEGTYIDLGTGKHSYECAGCGNRYTENHTFDATTGACVCGSKAVAKLVSGGATTYYATADEAFAAVMAAQSGVVTILADAELNEEHKTYLYQDISVVVEDGATLTLNNYLYVTGKLSGSGTITANGDYEVSTYHDGEIHDITILCRLHNGATIYSGTFKGWVRGNYGTISGGTFYEDVNNGDNDAEIRGGIFHGTVNNEGGTITGGTFNGKLINENEATPDFTGVESYGTIINTTPGSFVLGDDFTIDNRDAVINCTAHIWKDGSCRLCAYGCDHAGSTHDSCTYENSDEHSFLCSVCGDSATEAHTYVDHICACGKVETFTVTLMVDGAQYGETLTFEYGQTITLPENPTKTGYLFSGWQEEVPGTMPAENLTFTGFFTACDHAGSTHDHYTYESLGEHSYECSDCGATVKDTHEELYTVSQDGATCTASCKLCKEVLQVATLVAPACTIYGDGKSCKATVLMNDTVVESERGIAYYQWTNGQWVALEAAPTAAGTYRAEAVNVGDPNATNDDFTLFVEYTIGQRSVADITVTVDPNADLTYTGAAHEPGITVMLDGQYLLEDQDFVVAYTDNVNAGTATVTVTGIGNFTGLAQQTFVIGKAAAPAITFPTVVNAITYGEQLQDAKLSFYENQYGTFNWAAPDGVPGSAGTHDLALDFYPNEAALNNYDWKDTSDAQWIESRSALCAMGRVQVEQADISTQLRIFWTGDEYNGQPHQVQLINADKFEDTTLVAGVDYTLTYANVDPADVLSDGLPVYAGDYTVTVTGIGNYTGTLTQIYRGRDESGTPFYEDVMTVRQAYLSIDEETSFVLDKDYDGSAAAQVTLNYTGVVTGDDVTLVADAAFADANAGTGKTVTLRYRLEGTAADNYTADTDGTMTGNILPAWLIVVADDLNQVYGEEEPALTYVAHGLVSGDTLTGELVREAGTDAGTYQITQGTLAAGDNYELKFFGALLIITPKVLDGAAVTIVKSDLPYTGAEQTLEIIVDEGVTYEVLYGSDTGTDVANYELNVQFTGNYQGMATQGWRITPVAPEFEAPTAKELTYTGTAQELIEAGSTQHGTMVYALTVDGEYTEALPVGTDAGIYTVWYKVLGDRNHTDTAPSAMTVGINKAGLSVYALSNTITYGEAPAHKGVSYLGFLNGETAEVLGGQLTYTYTYTQYGNVGQYEIHVSGLGSNNYNITYYPGALVVEAMVMDGSAISLPESNLPYTGAEQTVEIIVADGVTYEVLYNSDTGTDVGNYELNIQFTGNYQGMATKGWQISPVAPESEAPTAKELTYNGQAQALVNAGSTQHGTMVYALTVDGEYSETIPTGVEATTYTVWYKILGDRNHTDTAPSALTATIAKAASNYDAPTAKELTYNGQAQALVNAGVSATGTVVYALAEDGTYTETIPTGTAAGEYTVWFKVIGGSNYLDSAPVKVDARIARLDITGKDMQITLGEALTYNGAQQTMAVEAVQLNDLAVTYDITGNTGTNAGDYTLTITGTGNFTGTAVKAWTIGVKAVTVTALDQSILFGAAISQDAYTVSGLAEGHSAAVTLTASTQKVTASGTVTAQLVITADGVDVTRNYTISSDPGALVIAPDTADIEELTVNNVTTSDEDAILAFQEMMASAESTKEAWDVMGEKVQELLDRIEEVEESIARIGEAVDSYDLATVKSSDQEALEALVEDIEGILATDNLTQEERAQLEGDKTACENLIAMIQGVDQLIGQLEETLEQKAPESVTSADRDSLEQIISDTQDLIDSGNVTDEEAVTLEEIKDKAQDLIDIIDETAAKQESIEEQMDALEEETVKSSDKETIEDVISDIDGLLNSDNLTEEERTALEEAKAEAEKLLDVIENAKDSVSTDNTEKVEDVTADNVQPEDQAALEDAKADLEQALENNSGNYTEAEKQAIADALQQIEEALEALKNAQAVDDAVAALPDSVEPDDTAAAEAIQEAMDAYAQLTDHEKTLVDAATKEKLEDLLADLTAYKITAGDGSSWTKGSTAGLSLTANGPLAKFAGIEVDGAAVDAANYQVTSGSTVIQLKAEYLQTLKVGQHTIQVRYTDGQTEAATFSIVKAAAAPSTGDDMLYLLHMAVMAISISALAVLLLSKKKTQIH